MELLENNILLVAMFLQIENVTGWGRHFWNAWKTDPKNDHRRYAILVVIFLLLSTASPIAPMTYTFATLGGIFIGFAVGMLSLTFLQPTTSLFVALFALAVPYLILGGRFEPQSIYETGMLVWCYTTAVCGFASLFFRWAALKAIVYAGHVGVLFLTTSALVWPLMSEVRDLSLFDLFVIGYMGWYFLVYVIFGVKYLIMMITALRPQNRKYFVPVINAVLGRQLSKLHIGVLLGTFLVLGLVLIAFPVDFQLKITLLLCWSAFAESLHSIKV